MTRLGTACLLMGLFGAACSDSSPAQEDPRPRPVIVDSDLAFADVLAVTLLLERPEVEVVAVTGTGTGVGRCPAAGRNMRAVMDRLGATEVPFACGRRAPLVGFNTAPTAWRDAADELAGTDLPAVDIDEDGAVDLLIASIKESSEPVTVLVTGPLTNVALAFEHDPTVLDNIDEIVIMGGAVDVGGNILSFSNFVAEFNIWIDPVAAQRVLEADVPITLIPLDATNAVPITPFFEEVFRTYRDASAAATLVADHNEENPLVGGQYQWDDLAAAALIDRDLFMIEQVRIRVVSEEGDAQGQTARDVAGRPIQVATAADGARFERLFYETLIGDPTPDISPWTADASILYDGTTCSYEGPDPLPAELTVETENTSGDPVLGLAVGRYERGTTVEQVDEFFNAPPVSPPTFFDISGIGTLHSRSRAVWVFRDLVDATIWCSPVGKATSEIAGLRLLGP